MHFCLLTHCSLVFSSILSLECRRRFLALVCDHSRASEHWCASVCLFSFHCCTGLSHGTLADDTVAHWPKKTSARESQSTHTPSLFVENSSRFHHHMVPQATSVIFADIVLDEDDSPYSGHEKYYQSSLTSCPFGTKTWVILNIGVQFFEINFWNTGYRFPMGGKPNP